MRRSRYLITAFFVQLSYIASSQFGFQYDNSIVVKQNGISLKNPWAGGLNYTQISDFDYDFDGDMDLSYLTGVKTISEYIPKKKMLV